MAETTPERLISHTRAAVIAPAGCGKTELIVKSVNLSTTGKQLVLTHTHAGVNSLVSRFRRLSVPQEKYKVLTIASFALEYSIAFPKKSSYSVTGEDQDWNQIYLGASEVIKSNVGKQIIRSSYAGVFVDEYQDCTDSQHLLIKCLAEILPCRILGDPLQGIFEFERIVNWQTSVLNFFEQLPDLTIPWRWINSNLKLGEWLLEVRKQIEKGIPISYKDLPAGVKKYSITPENQRKSCYAMLKEQGSTVAINKWKYQDHDLARRLNGVYKSIEEVEGVELLNTCGKLESSVACDRVLIFLDFASKCLTKVSSELATIRRKLLKKEFSTSRITKNLEVASALFDMAREGNNYQDYYAIMNNLEELPGANIFRPELWYDMKQLLRTNTREGNLIDSARKLRQIRRVSGRKEIQRIVTRVLLVKGLEYDNSIVLDTEGLTSKELYVALTRAKKSMIVHSND